jgi:uncharacterized membrane protein
MGVIGCFSCVYSMEKIKSITKDNTDYIMFWLVFLLAAYLVLLIIGARLQEYSSNHYSGTSNQKSAQELKRLKILKEKNILTEEEYQEKRTSWLNILKPVENKYKEFNGTAIYVVFISILGIIGSIRTLSKLGDLENAPDSFIKASDLSNYQFGAGLVFVLFIVLLVVGLSIFETKENLDRQEKKQAQEDAEQFHTLFKEGVLTEEEFQSRRNVISSKL